MLNANNTRSLEDEDSDDDGDDDGGGGSSDSRGISAGVTSKTEALAVGIGVVFGASIVGIIGLQAYVSANFPARLKLPNIRARNYV